MIAEKNEKMGLVPAYKGMPAYERMKNFLMSYRRCSKMSRGYEDELSLGLVSKEQRALRETLYEDCNKRCEEVREFISLCNLDGDERTVLKLHYIEGLSLDEVSEKIYVSRSTLYRIHKRAEYKALEYFMEFERR